MSINTILVPLDFSPNSIHALERACHLGQELRATLHLISIKEGPPNDGAERELMDRLMTVLPPAYELQNKVHREVLNGRIHQQLIGYAKKCHAESFRPREGRLTLPSDLNDFEARITTAPVAGGRALALRISSKANVYLPLESLGFSECGLKTIQTILSGNQGRFVFSSLHARDAASTISGLRDLGMSNRSIAGNLVGVVNQRLLRKLCEKCKKAVEPGEKCKESFSQLGFDQSALVYQAVGCEACRGTGFKGRCGVFECVQIDQQLAELMAHNATESELRNQIRSKGISSLTTEAMLKVRDGITCFDEANSLRWL